MDTPELIIRTLHVRYNPEDDYFVISTYATEYGIQHQPDAVSMKALSEEEQRACFLAAGTLANSLQQRAPRFSATAVYNFAMFVSDRDRKTLLFAREVKHHLRSFGISRTVLVGFEVATA
jgi:hypothetical protein